MRPAARHRCALTTLEVMVALCVLSVAGFALVSGIGFSYETERRTELKGRVLARSQAVVEEIRSTQFADVSTTYTDFSFDVEGVEPPAGRTNVGSVTIDTAQSTPTLLHLVIEASWVGIGTPETLRMVYRHVDIASN